MRAATVSSRTVDGVNSSMAEEWSEVEVGREEIRRSTSSHPLHVLASSVRVAYYDAFHPPATRLARSKSPVPPPPSSSPEAIFALLTLRTSVRLAPRLGGGSAERGRRVRARSSELGGIETVFSTSLVQVDPSLSLLHLFLSLPYFVTAMHNTLTRLATFVLFFSVVLAANETETAVRCSSLSSFSARFIDI